MKNVITGITDVFKDIGSTFAGFGKNMVEGIWNGISGATRWIKDKIQPQIPRVTHPAYFQEILIMSTSRNIQPV